ncbi:MAG TPA: hypothetical protein VFN62_09865 [Acidobacteriaceae bacterium]|nr:hypothetical protein [Acidobacteriaceae bacterium]
MAEICFADSPYSGEPDDRAFCPSLFNSFNPIMARYHMNIDFHIVLLYASRISFEKWLVMAGRLAKRLKNAELIIEVQKKVAGAPG